MTKRPSDPGAPVETEQNDSAGDALIDSLFGQEGTSPEEQPSEQERPPAAESDALAAAGEEDGEEVLDDLSDIEILDTDADILDVDAEAQLIEASEHAEPPELTAHSDEEPEAPTREPKELIQSDETVDVASGMTELPPSDQRFTEMPGSDQRPTNIPGAAMPTIEPPTLDARALEVAGMPHLPQQEGPASVETASVEDAESDQGSVSESDQGIVSESDQGSVSESDQGIVSEVSMADEPTVGGWGMASQPPPSEDAAEVFLDSNVGTDAVVTLIQRGERDAWMDRAAWLKEEALLMEDPRLRAKTLTQVSELYAMSGELGEASETVDAALEANAEDPLAHRLRRGVAAVSGQWTTVWEDFEQEAARAPTRFAQAHAHTVGGHLRRLISPNDTAYRTSFEHAIRADPNDIRPTLQTLSVDLAMSDEPPQPLESSGFTNLVDAVNVLRSMRSEGREGALSEQPYVLMLKARDALRRRDMAAAVDILERFDQYESLQGASRWLRSALAAPHAELRSKAITALAGVTEGSHGVIATRALVARALESGNDHAVADVCTAAAPEVLTATDRLVLAALTCSSPEALKSEHAEQWLAEASAQEAFAPLASAVAGFMGHCSELTASWTGGEPRVKASALLGRQLGALGFGDIRLSDMGPLIDAVAAMDPEHGVARVLNLERSLRQGDLHQLGVDLDSESPNAALVSLMLRARALEQAESPADEDVASFHRDHERLVGRWGAREVLVRMAMAWTVERAGQSAWLNHQGKSLEDPHDLRALDLQTGLRALRDGDAASALTLFAKTDEEYPVWDALHLLGPRLANVMNDDAAMRDWMNRRMQCRDDEPGLDRLRMALAIRSMDASERDRLLDEALEADPVNATLRELHMALTGRHAKCEPDDVTVAELALEMAIGHELDGDWEQMRAYVERAAQLDERQFVPIFQGRLARLGIGVDDEVGRRQVAVEAASEPHRTELVVELARDLLEAGRPKQARELLTKLRDQGSEDLVGLHLLSSAFITADDDEDAAKTSMAIARLLDGLESAGHSRSAARLMSRHDSNTAWVTFAQRALEEVPHDLWALRIVYDDAMARRDAVLLETTVRGLVEHPLGSLDHATLWLRVAECYVEAGQDDKAEPALLSALAAHPKHFLARGLLARLLERDGRLEQAAEAFERLANVARTPEARVQAYYRAASLWLARDDDEAKENGRRLLESVTELDAGYKDSFELLRAIYVASGAKRDLADLLAAHIHHVADDQRRTELEVMRGQILADTGALEEAKAALAAALAASPDNVDALRAFVSVCQTDEDWPSAEQALLRLGRLLQSEQEQAGIYMALGELYGGPLSNAERAEQSYQQVLKLTPEASEPRRMLVKLYVRGGATEAAIEQQQALVDLAGSPSEKCERTIEISSILEDIGDTDGAEASLIGARRAFNKQASPVRALVDFYRRQNKGAAADMLLGRAAAEVRRGLGAGRFESGLFEMTALVAELRGRHERAAIARASLSAIHGESTVVAGLGTPALNPHHDALVAPSVFSGPLRELLMRGGDLMDAAAPLDVAAAGGEPLPDDLSHIAERLNGLGQQIGIEATALFVADKVDGGCLAAAAVPNSGEGPTVLLDRSLVSEEATAVREFLLYRALKMIHARVATFVRCAPTDVGPLLGALLKIHCPDHEPTGVDPSKLELFRRRMLAADSVDDSDQLPELAREVIASLGNRASSLHSAAKMWTSRSALLATGDPSVAIDAISRTGTSSGALPTDSADRVKWIARHAEARDLLVFTLSPAYIELRGASAELSVR